MPCKMLTRWASLHALTVVCWGRREGSAAHVQPHMSTPALLESCLCAALHGPTCTAGEPLLMTLIL